MQCDSLELQIENTKHCGLCSELKLFCVSWGYVNSFMSSPKLSVSKDIHDINVRLVYGLRSVGKCCKATKVFCGVINLPPPQTKFERYNEVLGSAVEDVCFSSMDLSLIHI